jgi:peptide deformylase
MYTATQQRRIFNAGDTPVTGYLIWISVDRHPGAPELSNQLYREDPLTWAELGLTAVHEGRDPMTWRVKHDRDAFKELWLLFENDDGKFPLYPGEAATIVYSYTVSEKKWGQWFQRAVRLPTRRLSVELEFPEELDPAVWGTETTMAAASLPLRTAVRCVQDDCRKIYSWSTENPPLHARYRLAWKFRAHPDRQEGSAVSTSPREAMRSLGIVQDDDPLLRKPTRPFDLPTEAEDARRVVAQLHSTMERVATAHTFGKGMGLAAPQIGIDRSVALVRTPDGEAFTLLNPRVIEESSETDEQYEGCLSFFDVRGMVPRPLVLHVEHQDIDGNRRITVFERGVARLVAHELDHLDGKLYTDRMAPGAEPIPVSEYRGTGKTWRY